MPSFPISCRPPPLYCSPLRAADNGGSVPLISAAMEAGWISSAPRTVEEIFRDYSGRRTAIVRALTEDVDAFYAQCRPGDLDCFDPICHLSWFEFLEFRVLSARHCERENLCLYGHPSQTWEVNLPAEEVPPELPEPVLGINFARDGMNRKDWLSLVAVHSDSWLLSVSFYLGARLNRNDRKRLFSMINDLPTIFEVITDGGQLNEKSGMDNGSKSKLSMKRSSDGRLKNNSKTVDEGYGEDDDDEHSETLCGTCGGSYGANEFWIGCDICERWFHGKCVKITPAKAENIKQYKCPSCSSKKGR